MELNTDICINGVVVSAERATNIMFVQCTMLKKKYDIDMSVVPMRITIEGYSPDNVAIPDTPKQVDEPNTIQQTPKAKSSGCSTCNKKQ